MSDETNPDPRSSPYGYFVTDQFNVGQFRWCADAAAALRAYVNDDLIAALLEDDGAVIAATEALYRDATTAAKGLGDVVEALNAITDGYAAVRWCGTFKALCTGDDDFALELRGSWREDADDDEDPGRSIAEDEMDDFLEFLEGYGY